MQSAIGRVLLRKLPQFVEKRQHLGGLLSERLSQMAALRVVRPPDHLTICSAGPSCFCGRNS